MTPPPVVSVIIPLYNRAHLVGSAIETALAQTFRAIEVIVVDDGSTDDVETALAPFESDGRVRLVRKENGGAASARNRGIEEARGRFVAFLDSDDGWHPEKLDVQVAAATAEGAQDRVLVMTQTEIFSDDYRRIRPERALEPGERPGEFLYASDGFAQSSSMFLQRAFAREIGFNEELTQYEDHLFFIAAVERGERLVQIERPLVTLRDDGRADRLSRRKSLAAARRFREIAADLLTERAAVAFDATEIAPELWRESPAAALALQVRAYRLGAVGASKLVRNVARTVLPGSFHDWLRTARYRRGGRRNDRAETGEGTA
ncbi:glycosyltransferase family 2 protein [Tropicimonas isoalkanivorans]|uniref:Glycosyl transferase family 2 n=1 Tax=Tropicimonas isoalkanivorans TaxID=441112 RepID=A0A1I1R3X3_9RHOB|nr:glycosyltransferase family 2 protein [Tropicimonas isoalkanivorans]SFD26858.1 Glycosyl transferase family 2 [Tropicimonas isoalkanivorans]